MFNVTMDLVLSAGQVELRLGGLTSADELYRFSQTLSSRVRFVGAVGARLRVTGLMQRARGGGDP